MKKKIIFAVATGFFALATVFNMNLLQANSAGDVSLESIKIMQKAEAESIDPQNCRWNGFSRCTINNTLNSYCPMYACRAGY